MKLKDKAFDEIVDVFHERAIRYGKSRATCIYHYKDKWVDVLPEDFDNLCIIGALMTSPESRESVFEELEEEVEEQDE